MSAGTSAVKALMLASLLQDKLQVTQSSPSTQDDFTRHSHTEAPLSAAECHSPLSFDSTPGNLSNLHGNGRRVATRCGHLLHLNRDHDDEYCPVCTVIAYLNLLRRITNDWDGE